MARALHVDTTAELSRRTEAHHANLVTIFLTEERHGTELLGFLDRRVAMLVEREVLADHLVDDVLHLTELLSRHFLEIVEVEAQDLVVDIRTALLCLLTEHLLQCIVEEVRSCMVASRALTLLYIHLSVEVSSDVLRQFLDDMNALVVLALGVDDLDGLIGEDELTLVAYLTTHLSVERSLVEDDLIEHVLLLCHLTVTEDMCIAVVGVVADELLLALMHVDPVAVLHSGSVACTLFLLSHLLVEALGVYCEAVLTADKLGEVEWEAIGIEEAESLLALELCFAGSLQLVHVDGEEVDTTLERAEERVLLLLHHLRDEILLSLELRISTTHLSDEHGHELVHEGILLVEERVSITYGTAKDTADDVTSLGVARQLTVGNGESHGAQVVGDDADSNIHFLLSVDTLTIGALREGVVVFMA